MHKNKIQFKPSSSIYFLLYLLLISSLPLVDTTEIPHQNNTGFVASLFNPSIASHREKLIAIIEDEIEQKNEENTPMNLTFSKMVEWLRKYVNSSAFLETYADERSLELVAEATFWSVKLGLAPYLAKMSYTEIRGFKPLEELFSSNKTPRSIKIEEVANKMVKPAFSHEASYALGQAARCVYVHENGFDTAKQLRRF